MVRELRRPWAALAAPGDVFSYDAVLAAGIAPGRLRAAVARGEVRRVRRGWYAAWDDDPVVRHAQDCAAAVRAIAPTGVLSHGSAAFCQRISLLAEPEAPTLTRPAGRHLNRHGVKVLAAQLPAGHVSTAFGLPCTSPARTVIDVARHRSFLAGVITADSALRSGRLSLAELLAVLEDCIDWPGAANAQRVVGFADGRAETPLESVARVQLVAQGVPPPDDLQVDIHDEDGLVGRVDMLWRRYRVIGEPDGRTKYDATAARRPGGPDPRDVLWLEKLREERLERLGYAVVRFRWWPLLRQPAVEAQRFWAAVERAAWRAERARRTGS